MNTVKKLFEMGTMSIAKVFSALSSEKVQDILDDIFLNHPEEFSSTRREFINTYGFGIPCFELAQKLKSFDAVLELGAGSGYMRDVADNIICTDPAESGKWKWETASHVIKTDAVSAMRKYQTPAILLSWPYMIEGNAWFNQVLDLMSPGQTLIYVGEHYGCCANYEFFDQLHELFEEAENIIMPDWEGSCTICNVYTKK